MFSSIRVRWYDTDCNAKSALAAAVDAKSKFDPHLFLGPPCSVGRYKLYSNAFNKSENSACNDTFSSSKCKSNLFLDCKILLLTIKSCEIFVHTISLWQMFFYFIFSYKLVIVCLINLHNDSQLVFFKSNSFLYFDWIILLTLATQLKYHRVCTFTYTIQIYLHIHTMPQKQ